MNLEEYKIELLSDFEELINFYTGKDKMDDFLHNHLQDCEESHYCKTFCVRLKGNSGWRYAGHYSSCCRCSGHRQYPGAS